MSIMMINLRMSVLRGVEFDEDVERVDEMR